MSRPAETRRYRVVFDEDGETKTLVATDVSVSERRLELHWADDVVARVPFRCLVSVVDTAESSGDGNAHEI